MEKHIYLCILNQKQQERMLLSDLQTGERGVVVRVAGHGAFRKRIIEMGFIKGVTVETVLNAPLRDPIKYRIITLAYTNCFTVFVMFMILQSYLWTLGPHTCPGNRAFIF